MVYFSESDYNKYNYEPFFLINGSYQNALNEYNKFILDNYDFIIDEIDLINLKYVSAKTFLETKVKEIFKDEYIKLSNAGIYFYGCSFENYKANYETRLKSFMNTYIDANENDFIINELKLKIIYRFLFDENKKQMKFSISKRNDFLNHKLKAIHEPQTIVNNFDPNHFNQKAYNLFLYLVDRYEKCGKIKFINIYYFLKNDVKKDIYTFKFIQEKYTAYIKEKYNIEIKKYETAESYEAEKSVLNSFEDRFRKEMF